MDTVRIVERGTTADLVKYLESLLKDEGQDPHPPAVGSECCIFPVPEIFVQLNTDAFTPRFVQIGPFYSPNHLRLVWSFFSPARRQGTIKRKYLESFLQRSRVSLTDCVNRLKDWTTDILCCYDTRELVGDSKELVIDDGNGFVSCILLDACFIIEHLLRFYYLHKWERKDPIFSEPWLAEDVARDLALPHNQLPFFLLEELYNQAKTSVQAPSFLDIACKYFSYYHRLNVTTPHNLSGQKVLHFTHLLRMLYLGPPPPVGNAPRLEGGSRLPSATKLQDAGVKFKPSSKSPILEFQYENGALIMPCLVISDWTDTTFRNIIAFEISCDLFQAYMIDYIFLLRSLINTPKDVDMLVDKGILINFLNDSTAVVAMINNLCLNLPRSRVNCYGSLCDGLNKFYDDRYSEDKVILKKEYFGTKWKTASTVAAVALLLLTLIQTICSILSLIL